MARQLFPREQQNLVLRTWPRTLEVAQLSYLPDGTPVISLVVGTTQVPAAKEIDRQAEQE